MVCATASGDADDGRFGAMTDKPQHTHALGHRRRRRQVITAVYRTNNNTIDENNRHYQCDTRRFFCLKDVFLLHIPMILCHFS